MQEAQTSEEDQSLEASEEKGESIYHLPSIFSNYVFQII